MFKELPKLGYDVKKNMVRKHFLSQKQPKLGTYGLLSQDLLNV